MGKNARCVEVLSAEGKLMFSLRLFDEETGSADNGTASDNHANSDDRRRNGNGNGSANGSKDSAGMSEAQKRYLFRILAERGLEGDDAHRHLKERFGANTLADVSKREASSMIEQLLEEADAKAK
jgi:hypothetical protein